MSEKLTGYLADEKDEISPTNINVIHVITVNSEHTGQRSAKVWDSAAVTINGQRTSDKQPLAEDGHNGFKFHDLQVGDELELSGHPATEVKATRKVQPTAATATPKQVIGKPTTPTPEK